MLDRENISAIKEYRQLAGLTQKKFCDLFEIPIDVVKSWDSGRRKPPEWTTKLVIDKLKQMRNNKTDEARGDIMHINRVKINEFYVSYDLETISNKIQIVATFTKNGEIIHKIYNVRTMSHSGADMIAKLLNNDFAIQKANQIISDANQSTHSPFID